MVGDDRLYDRQPQAGAMLFRRVVRSEQTLTLFLGQSLARVRDVQAECGAVASRKRTDRLEFSRGAQRSKTQQRAIDGVEPRALSFF